jgi:hypothetical protein
VFIAFRVDLVETNKRSSPASSITKLGIVRFAIPKDGRSGGIIELPSFSSEQSARPTVQMPPLVERRDALDALDESFDEEPAPSSQRQRTSTLRGVTPFRAAPSGSNPAIALPALEDAEPAAEPKPAPAPERPVERKAGSWWYATFVGAAMA